MRKIFLLLLSAISVGAGIVLLEGVSLSQPLPPGVGDGYLLKRSQEETCHACHLTDQNTWSSNANSIKSHNSANTGSTKWGTTGWGVAGGQYGQIVCTTCHTAHDTKNIYLVKEVIGTPDSTNWGTAGSAWVTVDFRMKSGGIGTIGLMGDDSVAPRTSSTRVCEVCHSRTNYHKYNQLTTTGHENGNDCTGCHTHKMAFGGGGACDGCHGAPPGSGTDTNNAAQYAASHAQHYDRTAGGLPPGYTDATNRSAGTVYVFGCGKCHSTVSTDHGTSENNGIVDVKLNAGTDGWFTAGANLTANGPPPGSKTFYDSDGRCFSVYCHGNYSGSGLNATPIWGSSSTGACGTCHGASNNYPSHPNSGSHERHATWSTVTGFTDDRGYDCTLCHNGIVGGTGPSSYNISDTSKHVNDNVDWSFNWAGDSRVSTISSYSIASGTAAPSDGITREYGTCSNVYCHSNVQPDGGVGGPDTYGTPQWGNVYTCETCHNADGSHNFSDPGIDSGSHTKHREYTFNLNASNRPMTLCTICHKWEASAAYDSCDQCHLSEGEKTKHVDGNVDVLFDTYWGSVNGSWTSYSQAGAGSNPPGNGYGGCSSSYCHGNYTGSGLSATPTWGSAATGACGTCHGASNNYPSHPNSGSHERHATWSTADTAYTSGREYSCTLCHSDIVSVSGPSSYSISSKTKHVNKVVNWKFSWTSDARVSTISSYSIASGTQSPSDGVAREYGTCSNVYCHSNVQPNGGVGAPSSWGTPQWGFTYTCAETCHNADGSHNFSDPGIVSGSHTAHRAYKFNLTNDPITTCTICHKWNAPAAYDECTQCHLSAGEKAKHVDGRVDVLFDTYWGTGVYNGTSAPGNGYSNCSNTYCHSRGTGRTLETGDPRFVEANTSPVWGTITACNSCHGFEPGNDGTGRPWYTNRYPKANSHRVAQHQSRTCDKCHYFVTHNGTTIFSKVYHVNRRYNVNPNPNPPAVSFSYSYATNGGICATVSCHGGNVTRQWGTP